MTQVLRTFGTIRGMMLACLAPLRRTEENETMGRQAVVVLYVLAMVAVVVGVDVLFFRHQLWERLAVNVGIVLVFGACYFRFLKRP
jgi:cytochrome c oxidase subunit IV